MTGPKDPAKQIELRFVLPANPKAAREAAERLDELIALINEDKEEQAIDPAFFTGNLADYPAWLAQAFANHELKAAAERVCGCQAGDLADYDLETWYEDLFAGDAWDLRLDVEGPQGALRFQVREENYGGNLPLVWALFACGVATVKKGSELR